MKVHFAVEDGDFVSCFHHDKDFFLHKKICLYTFLGYIKMVAFFSSCCTNTPISLAQDKLHQASNEILFIKVLFLC